MSEADIEKPPYSSTTSPAQNPGPETLYISSGRDPAERHIVFPGRVQIQEASSEGFTIWSGESIHSGVTLDALDVSAKLDILCQEGIIGRKKAQVRAGRDVEARFVQNCRLAARGDIRVQAAIVNSRVYSLGKILLERGALLGGEAYAVHGVRARRLGNEAGQPTLVHVGSDFTMQQQLDQANEKLRLLCLKLQATRDEAAARPVLGLSAIMEQGARDEESLRTLITTLIIALDADEDATIEATEAVYPGTSIEICRAVLKVEEALGPSRFRLDKHGGGILVEAL